MVGEIEYWHCEDVRLNFSEKTMAKVMRALVELGGTMTSSFASGSRADRRWSDSWVAVFGLKPGTKDAFEDISGLKLQKPPRIQTGMREVEP